MVRGCGFVPAYSQKGGDILKKFLRFFNGLSNFLLTIGCVLLIACAAFVNATVFLRYIFHVSFQWAEEISRYLHIGVVILLCGPLLWMGGHINMDLLLLKLKGRTRKVVRIIGEIATLGLVSFTFYNSIIYVSSLYETHILTFSSKFEQWDAHHDYSSRILLCHGFLHCTHHSRDLAIQAGRLCGRVADGGDRRHP